VVGAIVVTGIAYMSGVRLTDRQTFMKDAQPSKSDQSSQELRVHEREAILENSPISLQAVNLADQARGLIFPIFNIARLNLTTEMFREAIRLDDQYFGGYAGAAQSLGALALLSSTGPMSVNLQTEAEEMAKKALRLAPTRSWTQSAAAWVAFTGKDFDRAIQISNRSVKLSPNDGNVLDFHALISLFSGDFKSAYDAANPNRNRTAGNQRFANRNIFAAANFHLGEYSQTIEMFKFSAKSGDPVSAPSLAYIAATNHALGNFKEAELKAGELSTFWPDFRAGTVFRTVFRHREHADAVVDRLLAAGWTPPNISNSGDSSK
jgi:tetratricopeptide (TPR) repeat protein